MDMGTRFMSQKQMKSARLYSKESLILMKVKSPTLDYVDRILQLLDDFSVALAM